MAQLLMAIEENPHCGHFPLRTFELLSTPLRFQSLIVELQGPVGTIEVVGWCSANGGAPCTVFAAIVPGDAAGNATLSYGGDQGVRIRPAGSKKPWSLSSTGQHRAPFRQVDLDVRYRSGS
jgi:hypothetical protein